MYKRQGELFIVSGPSGVGKTTVVTEFLRQHGKRYNVDRVVTYTTKSPRVMDKQGVDYHFITPQDFQDKVELGFFLEWSSEYGAFYGTPVSVLNDIALGRSKVLIIDRVGAQQVLNKYSRAILVWVQVSSIDVLRQRLNFRKTETFDQLKVRLSLAEKEINEELHAPMYHHTVSNDTLNAAIEGLFEVFERVFNCAKNDFLKINK